MTPKIQYIAVDINGNKSINNLRIKQYDKDIRYIYATITENGVPMDLSEYTGIVSVHKPDNTAVLNNVTEISDSLVKIQLTEQMGAAAGNALFEIQLRTVDGGVITTVTFMVKVDKAVNPSDTITSSYEFNALNEALEDVQESIEYIEDLKTLGILTADMKGVADGVASLDADAKIPIEQIPDEAKLWETLPSGHITNTDDTTAEIDGGAIIYGEPTQLPTGIGDYTLIRNNTISAHDGVAYKDLNIGSIYDTDKTPLTMKADGSTIINTPSTKTTPIDADNLYVSDSADSSKLKKTTLANFKATLKSYFDTLYTAFIPIAQKGTANGVAETDADNKIAGDVLTKIINDLASSTTRTYSSDKINALISGVVGLELLVVTVLPTENINPHAIYLVPQVVPETSDNYDEFVYIDNAWEHIGSTSVDLSDYLKKTDNYASSSSSAGAADSAVKLSTSRTIDGISFDGTAIVSRYGVSSTAASTVAKEVTIDNFSLVTGARVSIKFTNGNSVNSPTLNVSTTGAKFIYIGTVQAIASDIVAGSIYDMVYDGTNYQLVTPPSESIVLTQAQYDSLSVGEQNNGKTYFISDAPDGDVNANLVSYSNTTSGLSATNIQEAVDELASEKLDKVGDAKDTTVTFTEAVTLANVNSGESGSTLWGKVKKLFSFIGTTTLTSFATTITTAINELVKIAIGTTLTYSASSTYALGAYTLYQGNLCRCITAITVGEPFNTTKWTIVSIISDLLVTRTASVKVVEYTITNQAMGSGQNFLVQNLQTLLGTGQTIKGYSYTITNSTNTTYIKSVINFNNGIILELSNADTISAKVYVYYV